MKSLKRRLYEKPPTTLGSHLRKRRLELGHLQKEVAIALGINTWTYLLWEHDSTVPSIGMWPQILSFLGYDPFPRPKDFAGKLMSIRRRLGLSQERLARQLGIDEVALARWENGRSKPSDEQVQIVEAFLASGE